MLAICAVKPDVESMGLASNSRSNAAGIENSTSIRLVDSSIDRRPTSGPQIEVWALVKRTVPMRCLYRQDTVCYCFDVLRLLAP